VEEQKRIEARRKSSRESKRRSRERKQVLQRAASLLLQNHIVERAAVLEEAPVVLEEAPVVLEEAPVVLEEAPAVATMLQIEYRRMKSELEVERKKNIDALEITKHYIQVMEELKSKHTVVVEEITKNCIEVVKEIKSEHIVVVEKITKNHSAEMKDQMKETDSMQSKYEAAMRVALLVCTTDTDRKANEKEAKRLMKEAKGETTRDVLDEDWWNPGLACTATSKFRQAAVEKGQTDPGRFTVKSAKQFGFHCIDILDDLLLEEAKLQLLDCTASKCILSIDHPGVQELIKLLQKSFYRGEEKCHSRLHFNHANFHAPKGMNEIYKAVALELGDGITIRSASNFRNKAIALAEKAPAETETVGTVPAASIDDMPELLDEEETNPGTDVTTWTSLELMQFLGDHWDTHALPTTFFSFSANDSYVYYKLQNKIVAKLLIPAGFSIVVTTEIHSGLKTLNPYKLKHCSESSDDRLLFRIVHQVGPEGINMDRSSDSWLKFATDAVKKIFNRQK
jgi:hypothetical protein